MKLFRLDKFFWPSGLTSKQDVALYLHNINIDRKISKYNRVPFNDHYRQFRSIK